MVGGLLFVSLDFVCIFFILFGSEKVAVIMWKEVRSSRWVGFKFWRPLLCGVEQSWLTLLRKLVWQALHFGHISAHVQSWLNKSAYSEYATTNISSEKSSGEFDVLFQMTYILR